VFSDVCFEREREAHQEIQGAVDYIKRSMIKMRKGNIQ